MMNNNYEDMFDLKMSRLEDNMDKYPVMKKACIEIGKGIGDYEKIINPDNFQDLKLNLEDEINILTAMNRSCGTNISSVEAYISSISTKPSMSELIDKLSSELAIDSNIDENMICSYILVKYIMREYFPDMIGDIVISSSDTITTEDNNVSDGETTVWDKLDENSSDDSSEDITDISSRFESMFASALNNIIANDEIITEDDIGNNLNDNPLATIKEMVANGLFNENNAECITSIRNLFNNVQIDMMDLNLKTDSLSDSDILDILYTINNVDSSLDIFNKITTTINDTIEEKIDLLEGKTEKEILDWICESGILMEISNQLGCDDKRMQSGIYAIITMIIDGIYAMLEKNSEEEFNLNEYVEEKYGSVSAVNLEGKTDEEKETIGKLFGFSFIPMIFSKKECRI